MKKEAKQTIISLSLAGAIGYYLYNKLMKAGKGPSVIGANHESAADKTKNELSWRPEPIVETPAAEEVEVPEAIFAETEIVDEINEPVIDEVAEEAIEDVADEVAEDSADVGGCICSGCGALNANGAEVCECCGTAFEANADEVAEDSDDAEEPIADGDAIVIEEPVLEIDKIDEEAVEAEDVYEEADEADSEEEEEDTPIDDLFEAVKDEEPEEVVEQTVMDNVEPLHKIDNKDPSAKKEFKNIMDFFKTL